MMYSSTQYGRFTIIPLLIIGLIVHFFSNHLIWQALSMDALFLLLIFMFYKLRIEIYSDKIKLIYGIGIIRITFKIISYSSVQQIKTPWYYGYGIRITPIGWLYNIQGPHAVILKYEGENNTRNEFSIGTQFPERLEACIENTFIYKP